MIHKIFIYWDTGFSQAPSSIKRYLAKLVSLNKDWEIILLDEKSISKYISIPSNIRLNLLNIKEKSLLYSIYLLDKYGGVWISPTLLCNVSLSDWLVNKINSGFFSFNKPNKYQSISSWFIYSEPHNPIISKWKLEIETGWNKDSNPDTISWIHNIFSKKILENKELTKIWNVTPKVNARPLQIFKFQGLTNSLTNKIEQELLHNKLPFYKLSVNYDSSLYHKECCLAKILDSIQFRYIVDSKFINPIIKNNIVLHSTNLNYNPSQELYFIWIRNPIERFVTVFTRIYNILHYDVSKLDVKNIPNILDNNLILKKLTNSFVISPRFDFIINHFQNANNLAEAIYSTESKEKELALELLNDKLGEFYRGLSYYLNNGEFIKDNHHRIIMVGAEENLNSDLTKLSMYSDTKTTHNQNHLIPDKLEMELSDLAIENIKKFYANTEYKTLQIMLDYNLISSELYNNYLEFLTN